MFERTCRHLALVASSSPDEWRAAVPPADGQWLACEYPDEPLRHGAYLCDCGVCIAALRRAVYDEARPELSVVVVTDTERITTNAFELLARLEVDEPYDGVRAVYVGQGTTEVPRREPIDGFDVAGPIETLSLVLPAEVERFARRSARAAGMSLETWIVEALRTAVRACAS